MHISIDHVRAVGCRTMGNGLTWQYEFVVTANRQLARCGMFGHVPNIFIYLLSGWSNCLADRQHYKIYPKREKRIMYAITHTNSTLQ
jgi:hypothetical protein